jgi:ABC-type phosphate transport system permease subunit/ABC-type phosphate transport system auxiliary subunit
MVWLTGSALVLCVLMIAALLGVVLFEGARAFWPKPIEKITLKDGTVLLGMPIRTEAYDPPPEERAMIDALRADLAGRAGGVVQGGSGEEAAAIAVLDEHGRPLRRLYQTGNREFRGQPFQWVPIHSVAKIERPAGAVLLERMAWGPWLGEPRGVLSVRTLELPGTKEQIEASGQVQTPDGPRRVERVVKGEPGAGRVPVEEKVWLAESPADSWALFQRMLPEAELRRERAISLRVHAVGDVNARLERERLRVRSAELLAMQSPGARGATAGAGTTDRAGAVGGPGSTAQSSAKTAAGGGSGGPSGVFGGDASRGMPVGLWLVVLSLAGGGVAAGLALRRRAEGRLTVPAGRSIASSALWVLSGLLLLGAAMEHPWAGRGVSSRELAAVRAEAAEIIAGLQKEYEQILVKIQEIEAEDARFRVLFVEPTTNRFAPAQQTTPDEPIRVSGIVRAVAANDLGAMGKLGVYLARWREFLFSEPRESNTEGGVFPVIFGTVLLTILLSVVVVPLGVVAALYLREYAKQGPLTSAIRVAVNNLAGVPSIVYGVFGLGFFCYTLGVFVDQGSGVRPGDQASLLGLEMSARGRWWAVAAVMAVTGISGLALGLLAKPVPGLHRTRGQRVMSSLAVMGWVVAAAGVVWLVARSPYFGGFFAAKAPSPTFGAKGLLWSALTLALLTLPVVIVATEEAIASVPRTMREGSYGCGATQWQTIRRIVLLRAMPGIMTGAILAMARGAGEVAPLMLVGAVKLAPEWPLTGDFPFLHLDRSFMHLGFHIYDVGFQSPDSEAARPLVWCTTLLLIVVVVALNAAAIRIRSRLRRKFLGESF